MQGGTSKVDVIRELVIGYYGASPGEWAVAERALGIEAVEEAVVVRQLPWTRANPMAVETNIALANADRMLARFADGLHVDAS